MTWQSISAIISATGAIGILSAVIGYLICQNKHERIKAAEALKLELKHREAQKILSQPRPLDWSESIKRL